MVVVVLAEKVGQVEMVELLEALIDYMMLIRQ
jgi:hypothetical protein